MTPEKQRIAIAEARGAKWLRFHDGFHEILTFKHNHSEMSGNVYISESRVLGYDIPDYLNDLNAMHEACELVFGNSNAWVGFIESLCDIVHANNVSMVDALVLSNRATAAQRAKAFLKTIGKWEEE